MKGIFWVCLCVAFCRCGECNNSNSYQIKSVLPDAALTWKCHFVAEGLGPCATWQKTQQIIFADSCSKFALSQILSRAQISKYQ